MPAQNNIVQNLDAFSDAPITLENEDTFEDLIMNAKNVMFYDQNDPSKNSFIIPVTTLKHPASVYLICVYFYQKAANGRYHSCETLDPDEPITVNVVLHDAFLKNVLSVLGPYPDIYNANEQEQVLNEIRRMYMSLPNIRFN